MGEVAPSKLLVLQKHLTVGSMMSMNASETCMVIHVAQRRMPMRLS